MCRPVYAYNSRSMELYVVAFVMLACVILALWLLARRIRAWKEQILHAVSIVESNNAIAHDVTRKEASQQFALVSRQLASASEQLASASEQLAALERETDEVRKQIQESLQPDLASIRREVQDISEQTNLRRLVRAILGPPRLIANSHPPSVRFDDALAFLRSLDIDGDEPESGRNYLEVHIRRLARTLDITPPPSSTRRALELGAYMQITPALACLLGYDEVRGAYLGRADQSPFRKTVTIGHRQVFACEIDFFDAEKDPFPYPDSHFDVVLACEILEHLRLDPMHMLLESRRVLAPNGALVLTTPNTASFTSIARALGGVSPQIWSRYPLSGTELPHVREYTPAEVHDILIDAGFTIEWLFTEPINSGTAETWMGPVIDHLGFSNNLRGEQIYLVARKRTEANIIRRPEFLYEHP
jgi:SAM-dependent methyltransferase